MNAEVDDELAQDTVAAQPKVDVPPLTPAPAATLAAPVTGGGRDVDLGLILDIPVTLTVEVGQASMSIARLLALGQGAVVELNRVAGEPLDVLANGTLVARGEVVVVEDKFGIRLTEVLNPVERTRSVA
ncbi:flagellar motor switch protein FliN [Immundisolibacter sp.]|uniref:flagellar motor switch protein FliN n=1 Tax=Immundisolibacter sp. TaxID=1934948 RepID=UPI003564D7F3